MENRPRDVSEVHKSEMTFPLPETTSAGFLELLRKKHPSRDLQISEPCKRTLDLQLAATLSYRDDTYA